MSKAGTPIKVLRTAYKRVEKGWTQGDWSTEGSDGKYYVCLEGALFGYCNSNEHGLTDAQKGAREVVLQIIGERYGRQYHSIPAFNDSPGRTKDEVLEVIKLAIIRLETTGEGEIDDDEFDSILEWAENHKN